MFGSVVLRGVKEVVDAVGLVVVEVIVVDTEFVIVVEVVGAVGLVEVEVIVVDGEFVIVVVV